MTIKRVNSGRGHSYVDTDTGLRVPGVTTILRDGIPKPALEEWKVNTTVDFALDHWERLSTLSLSERRKELLKARYAERDAAANKGTQIHRIGQRVVAGERVAVPDEIAGHVESYVRFLDEFDVQPILVERTVVHRRHRCCGTFDLIADLIDVEDPEPVWSRKRRQNWLLDIKSGRSGIFGDVALQLAPYGFADVWIDDEGEEHPLPPIDRYGAIHVRADGYDLVPLTVDPDVFRAFLYIQQVARVVTESRDWVGEPLISPRTSTYRLVKDDVT